MNAFPQEKVLSLREISVPSANGYLLPVSEPVKVREGIEDKTIYHKNLKRVVYITGDVADAAESLVYAILKMKDAIKKLKPAEGYELKQYSFVQPWIENTCSMKWDGEWHITYEVFKDLGTAFAASGHIFQGLAMAMMFGAIAATVLTLIAVPLLYYEYFNEKVCPLRAEQVEMNAGEKSAKKMKFKKEYAIIT